MYKWIIYLFMRTDGNKGLLGGWSNRHGGRCDIGGSDKGGSNRRKLGLGYRRGGGGCTGQTYPRCGHGGQRVEVLEHLLQLNINQRNGISPPNIRRWKFTSWEISSCKFRVQYYLRSIVTGSRWNLLTLEPSHAVHARQSKNWNLS